MAKLSHNVDIRDSTRALNGLAGELLFQETHSAVAVGGNEKESRLAASRKVD
jgi:hypothetical protein